MPLKKINVVVWLVKAAELEDIHKCCLTKLVGLRFDLIYSLPYAMCLNTVSEIMSTLEIEDDQSIVATSRFSSIGLVPADQMALMQKRVVDFVKETPINVDVWQEVAPEFVALAVRKAKSSIASTFGELAKKPSNFFNLMVINNDRMPLLELLTIPINKSLRVPTAGEIVQLRFDVTVDGKKINAKLVYAALESAT
jgi:hypothetical protein